MATRKKALRNTKTGRLFPLNESLARHDDIETVVLDKDGKVVEPEEVGPAAAMDLPNPEKSGEEDSSDGEEDSSDGEEDSSDGEEDSSEGAEGASAADSAKADTRSSRRTRK